VEGWLGVQEEGRAMPKFVIISRDFGMKTIDVFKGTFPDQHKAWDHIEEQIANTNTREWLLTPEEAKKLKEQL